MWDWTNMMVNNSFNSISFNLKRHQNHINWQSHPDSRVKSEWQRPLHLKDRCQNCIVEPDQSWSSPRKQHYGFKILGLTKPTEKCLEDCQPVSVKALAHVIHSIRIDSKQLYKTVQGATGCLKSGMDDRLGRVCTLKPQLKKSEFLKL